MAPRTALALLSVWCLSLIRIGAEGRKSSEEEHQELEKHFKIYNKSGVKTILMKPLSYSKDNKKKQTRTLIKLAKNTLVQVKPLLI
ncbi:conserved hypothetical protein [Ricinus communis]|uniref:Uncharacterized protein n=1 Tax=Ricinus communis TaxID=3988 RepID=B9SAY2_RICCO|nr:conserved hypothetical protein [Ricinus communis]